MASDQMVIGLIEPASEAHERLIDAGLVPEPTVPAEQTRNGIVARMHTTVAIAQWHAAQEFLDAFGDEAERQATDAKWRGMSEADADHVAYCIKVLRTEAVGK